MSSDIEVVSKKIEFWHFVIVIAGILITGTLGWASVTNAVDGLAVAVDMEAKNHADLKSEVSEVKLTTSARLGRIEANQINMEKRFDEQEKDSREQRSDIKDILKILREQR